MKAKYSLGKPFYGSLSSVLLLAIIGVWGLATSCDSPNTESSNGQRNDHSSEPISQTSKEEGEALRNNRPELEKTAFQLGHSKAVTNNENGECVMKLACDCCSINLVFGVDGICYWVEPCSGDVSVRRGTYQLEEEEIVIALESNKFVKEYNWASETDDSVEPHGYQTESEEARVIRLSWESCKDQTKLVVKGSKMVGLQGPLDYGMEWEKAQTICEKSERNAP